MSIEKITSLDRLDTSSTRPKSTSSVAKLSALIKGAVFASTMAASAPALAGSGPIVTTSRQGDYPTFALEANEKTYLLLQSNSTDAKLRVATSDDNFASATLLQGYEYDPGVGLISVAICPPEQSCQGKKAIFLNDKTHSYYGSKIVGCSSISSDYTTVSGCLPMSFSPDIPATSVGISLSEDGNYLLVGNNVTVGISKLNLATGVMTSINISASAVDSPLGGFVYDGKLFVGNSDGSQTGFININPVTNMCPTGETFHAANTIFNGGIDSSGYANGAITKSGTLFYANAEGNLKITADCGNSICNITENTATCPADCPTTGTGGAGGAGGSPSTGGSAGSGGTTGGTGGLSTGGTLTGGTGGILTGGTAGTGGVANICGDGKTAGTEQCDNAAANGEACVAAYGSSCTYCDDTCHTQPIAGANCGDGTVNGPEQCDTNNLNNGTCNSLGAGASGTLTCTDTCTFDASNCSNPPTCGDGTCSEAENCLDCASDCGACQSCNATISADSTCTLDCIDPNQATATAGPGPCKINYQIPGAAKPMKIDIVDAPAGTQIPLIYNAAKPNELHPTFPLVGIKKIRLDDQNAAKLHYTMGDVDAIAEGTATELNHVTGGIYQKAQLSKSYLMNQRSTSKVIDFDLGAGTGRIPEGTSIYLNYALAKVVESGTGGNQNAGGSAATGGSANEAGSAGEAPITNKKSSSGDDKGCSISQPGENGNTNGALGAFALVATVAAMRSGRKRKQ